jgi:hypothetical protein
MALGNGSPVVDQGIFCATRLFTSAALVERDAIAWTWKIRRGLALDGAPAGASGTA